MLSMISQARHTLDSLQMIVLSLVFFLFGFIIVFAYHHQIYLIFILIMIRKGSNDYHYIL